MVGLRNGARVRCGVLVVTVASVALPVGSALGAPPTTIGQTGAPLTTQLMGSGVERAETGAVIPADGRVRSFQFQAGSCVFAAGSYDFQVLRPVGTNQYQVVGRTGTLTNPCDGKLHTYRVNIRVRAGDVLGVYVVTPWEGVLNVPAPESIAVRIAQPAVNAVVTVRPIIANDSSADLSATVVPNNGQGGQGGDNDHDGTP
jgi:hypothetical protein